MVNKNEMTKQKPIRTTPKKFRVLKSPLSGSRIPMQIKVPKNIKSSKKPSKN